MNYKRKLEQFETLTDVASLINSSLNHAEIRKRTIEATTRVLNVEAASLLLIDEKTGNLYFDIATGEKGKKVKKVRLEKGKGVVGYVVESGESIIIHDAASDPRFSKKADKTSGFITRNIICTPVRSKKRIIGVLEGINKKDGQFDENDIKLIKSLTNYVAVAIENARLYRDLREIFYSTIEVMAEIIELRDRYTGGHTKRVKDLSVIIGKRMKLNKADIENLKLASILHDIGKIGIADNVLNKHGKLEREELKKMNMHPLYGAELLNHIKQLKDVIPGIRGHHERYDGNGYPDRLKKGAIPLIARIISAADTFDAMTTDRPYRKGLSKETALKELKQLAGIQFDPEVIETFLTSFKDNKLLDTDT